MDTGEQATETRSDRRRGRCSYGCGTGFGYVLCRGGRDGKGFPADAGVKMPELLTLPIVDGLTDQFTALLKLPVPVTVGVQEDV